MKKGARLGNSALSIQFEKDVPWISPTYESAAVSSSGDTVSVTVTLGNATALQTTAPFNVPQCARQMLCVGDKDDQSTPWAASLQHNSIFSGLKTQESMGAVGSCTFKPSCE